MTRDGTFRSSLTADQTDPGRAATGFHCPQLRRPPLDPADLTATPWDDAQAKARMGNALLSFIARGMPRSAFTKPLYRRLSMMFGFIACYNQHGFWGTHFGTTGARAVFLEQIVTWPCWGSPDATWCDVEREIAERVRSQGLVAAYRQATLREDEHSERATLARLLTKYGPSAPKPMQPPTPEQMGLL